MKRICVKFTILLMMVICTLFINSDIQAKKTKTSCELICPEGYHCDYRMYECVCDCPDEVGNCYLPCGIKP